MQIEVEGPSRKYAIPTVVCACFYADLRVGIPVVLDGGAKYDECVRLSLYRLDEDIETVTLRQDLERVGRAEFTRCWKQLLALVDSSSRQAVYEMLHGVFAPVVEQAFARRAQHKGQA